MRLAFVSAFSLVVLSSVCASAQGTPQPPLPNTTGIGEIHGQLTDSASGQPIVAGSITVRRDTTFAGGALPKSDGTFRVDGLPPGRYTLRFRALGLAPMTRNNLIITA